MASVESFAVIIALTTGLGKTAVRAEVRFSTTQDNDTSRNGDVPSEPPYWCLDLLLSPESDAGQSQNGFTPLATKELDLTLRSDAATTFLAECIQHSQESGKAAYVRLVFSRHAGFVTRSDFLELRLQCCHHVAKTVSFLSPLQAVDALGPEGMTPDRLLQAFDLAIGGILAHTASLDAASEVSSHLDGELTRRLSFPWLVSQPPQRKRIAWVQGRENINVSRQAYQAAYALGITLVVIDNAGHWLQDDHGPFAHLREAFLPVNINFDPGFTQRIVEAVRGYPLPIDGIVTISDVRLKLVAEACEILGLPTSPSAAYIIAGDKAKTRLLEPDAKESFVLSSAEDLGPILRERGSSLQYPLIVKPCLGWNSDCVSKVANESELEEAVRRASMRHADAPDPSVSVVVEPYIDGPEVDANMVLLDGEVIFFEISDDFPSRGDAADAGLDDGFQETRVVMPTALPDSEVVSLRDALRDSILRQGFQSGVFHCEARVRNSTSHYTTKDDIFDLTSRSESSQQAKSVYLHEVNARPPGYLESVAVTQTYGVDYYASRLLLALGSSENDRLRALSHPFLGRHQFHLSIVIIPQTRAGVMKTVDAGASFLLQHPELRERIPYYDTWLKGGDILEGPKAEALWWIANLSVVSRESRQDCLRLVKFVEENFSYELEGDE